MATPAPDPVPTPVITQARRARKPSPQATGLACSIADLLALHQAERIVILDVSGPLAITDWFVIATVGSTRQGQALAKELDYGVKALRGHRKRNQGGMESEDSNWVLLDFDEVVVHLFLPEARAYYDLESLWADAPRLDYTPQPRALEPSHGGTPGADLAAPGIAQFRVYPRLDPPGD